MHRLSPPAGEAAEAPGRGSGLPSSSYTMPHKIGFVVVSSSGHEDGFSARELMVHAPTVSGWRSPRFCQFPQEIVVQMVERSRIRKLQLLAHQYMIASKVEFYVSESLPEYLAPYQAERFRRLGYVSLSDNEKTGCRARELKSVYVDAVGQFLKLIFHQNHANKYNIYNQVALVAINIIGDPADFGDESNITSREKLIDHYLAHAAEDPALEGTSTGKSNYISPLDDLAFDMYQDPEVAQLIRRLDEQKREAVRAERYDHAKKLKQAIADLQKVGERLGRYEVEKRCAVEKEDYDLAKEKQQQMQRYRAQVYAQLQHHGLEEPELMRAPLELGPQPLGPPGSPRNLPQEDAATSEKPPALVPGVTPPRAPATRSPATEPGPSAQLEPLPYDERPLPTSRQPQAAGRSDPDISDTPGGPVGEPEPLTEKAWREAGSAIEVLGEKLVAGAYSRTWSCREDALLALYKQLAEMPLDTPKEELKNTLRASVFLVRKAIRDVVTPVFQASLKLLKLLVTQFIPKHRLGRPEAVHCVERTIPVLLSRTGDTSARLRLMASNFIQEMALFKEVRALQMVPSYLLQPLKANASPHLALSQMGLLARLLRDLGTGSNGFPVDAVMKFTVSALEHRVYEVRDSAVQIILDLYREHRAVVLEHLPPDDAVTRKNVLYRTIFDGFARIDGRPTDAELRAQRKAATEEAEKRKRDEIQALQEQRDALRELEAEVQARDTDAAKDQAQESPGRKADPQDAPETPDNHYLDKLCIFCGERNEAFTGEGLDLHYWKFCLMLTRCGHCQQVVEISSLTEHLLTECDKKDEFGKCYRCSEAVLQAELPGHIKAKDCNPAKPEKLASRCPLCHENFSPGEEAWRAHLMGPGGCTRNPRKTHLAPRAPVLPPGRSAAGIKAVASSSKVASKIPTPKGGLTKNSSRTYTKR